MAGRSGMLQPLDRPKWRLPSLFPWGLVPVRPLSDMALPALRLQSAEAPTGLQKSYQDAVRKHGSNSFKVCDDYRVHRFKGR